MKRAEQQISQDIRERTFAFAVRILKFCRRLESNSGASRTLARQLLRAATSIGANAEEAQAAQSKADFINKNAIALKEARETHYWLRLIATADLAGEPELAVLTDEALQIKRIFGAIIVSTKKGMENTK